MNWGVLIIGAVVSFGVLIIAGLICIASEDTYDERDCRATVDRSNGLSEEREE